MSNIKQYPKFNDNEIDEIYNSLRDEDINKVRDRIGTLAFHMFEKINDYFNFDENERLEKRCNFIENTKENEYNTYEELSNSGWSDLKKKLQNLLINYINFYLTKPRVDN